MSAGLPRWLEAGGAAVGLVLLAPILAAAALAVRLSSAGPVLFRQERVGRGGRRFVMLKLRTMRHGASGAAVTSGGDPRVTRVGRVLRRLKLDELPELWNVVRGDMSLVGPRPEVPRFVDPGDPRWASVLSVRPGITDPTTIALRDEEGLLAAVDGDPEAYYRDVLLSRKLAGYVEYLESRSAWRDVLVIWRTLLALVGAGATGRRSGLARSEPPLAPAMVHRVGIRFRPPRVEVSPETRWLLARAFSRSASVPSAGALDPPRVVATATALDLAARVGARTELGLLQSEVGPEAADAFHAAFEVSAVRTAALLRLCREVALVADRLGAPLFVLKGVAQVALGQSRPGERTVHDLDVLVPGQQAEALHSQLVSLGYRQLPGPRIRHHLAILQHPFGLRVEIHFALPRLGDPSGPGLSAEEIVAAGAWEQLPGMPANCRVLAPSLRVALALVHGLASHGMQPFRYPFGRLVGDVVDVGWDPPRWRQLLAEHGGQFLHEVSDDEVLALAALAEALGAGVDAAEVEARGDGAAVMLRHWLRGVGDDYRMVMRLRKYAEGEDGRPRVLRLARGSLDLAAEGADRAAAELPQGRNGRGKLKLIWLGTRAARFGAALTRFELRRLAAWALRSRRDRV